MTYDVRNQVVNNNDSVFGFPKGNIVQLITGRYPAELNPPPSHAVIGINENIGANTHRVSPGTIYRLDDSYTQENEASVKRRILELDPGAEDFKCDEISLFPAGGLGQKPVKTLKQSKMEWGIHLKTYNVADLNTRYTVMEVRSSKSKEHKRARKNGSARIFYFCVYGEQVNEVLRGIQNGLYPIKAR